MRSERPLVPLTWTRRRASVSNVDGSELGWNIVSRQDPGFGGMTVNERLFMAGLLPQFDAAIDAEDRHRAIEWLVQVEMTPDSASATVDAVLANPSNYGYSRRS